jgi:hypothetical protein
VTESEAQKVAELVANVAQAFAKRLCRYEPVSVAGWDPPLTVLCARQFPEYRWAVEIPPADRPYQVRLFAQRKRDVAGGGGGQKQ